MPGIPQKLAMAHPNVVSLTLLLLLLSLLMPISGQHNSRFEGADWWTV